MTFSVKTKMPVAVVVAVWAVNAMVGTGLDILHAAELPVPPSTRTAAAETAAASRPAANEQIISGTGPHAVANLAPLTLYQITQRGKLHFLRVSSAKGVVLFESKDAGPFVVAPVAAQVPPAVKNPYSRFAALVTPAPGETFVAPAELRLIASACSTGGGPKREEKIPGADYPSMDRVEFYVDDAKVADVDWRKCECGVFKTRASGVAAGRHAVWVRGFVGEDYYDSRPHMINVVPPPLYQKTITLDADLDITGQAYNLAGTAESRISVVGNGHRIVGKPASFSAAYVDFSDLGDRAAVNTNGLEITTTGNVAVDHCRFYANDILSFTTNGTSAVTVTNNHFASNSRQPIGQLPDLYGGGVAHSSWPALVLAGSSSAAKVLQTNNFGAGWVALSSPNWTVGGATAAAGNVAIGARVGIYISGRFTGTISHNYTHHVYYGGWSQGSNYELGNLTSVLVEHNVISGSSWPVRGLAGEFRYNLITGDGSEGFIWTQKAGPTNIHHNVLYGAGITRGAIFQIYGATGTMIRNNTFDMVDKRGDPINLTSGSADFNSNLVMHHVAPSVRIGAATITADYNAWFDMAGAHFSDGRNPEHDVTGDPGIRHELSLLDWSWEDVWNRTRTVSQVLADFRTFETPTATVIDAGDPSVYGPGNDIGAIGGGTPNASDLFGKK